MDSIIFVTICTLSQAGSMDVLFTLNTAYNCDFHGRQHQAEGLRIICLDD